MRIIILAVWVTLSHNLYGASATILDLKLQPGAIRALNQEKFSNKRVEALMTLGGQSNLPVQLRYRGRWSRSWNKTPLKIFLPDETAEKRQCLNLNSTFRDASWVRERLAYHVYELAGVPASKTRFVEVRLNSKFHGAYVDVEQVDGLFLKSRGLQGEVFKSIGAMHAGDERKLSNDNDYPREYEKQNRKKSGYQSLIQFCSDLDAATDIDAFFKNRVDLDRYTSYLAANILIQNWDGLNKNHVMVHLDGTPGKWFAVPWDVDRTLGDWPSSTHRGNFNMVKLPIETGTETRPGVTGWNRLQDKFWKSKALRNRLADRLEELLRTEFNSSKLDPVIDAWAAEIAPLVERDRAIWGSQSELGFEDGVKEVKSFVPRRIAFVKQQISNLRN